MRQRKNPNPPQLLSDINTYNALMATHKEIVTCFEQVCDDYRFTSRFHFEVVAATVERPCIQQGRLYVNPFVIFDEAGWVDLYNCFYAYLNV